MARIVVGVDVAKGWIDVFEEGVGHARYSMEAKTLREAARAWKVRDAFVVFEASGGYDRPLRAALEAAGVAHARVNPARARHFSRAAGRLGKTDRVDAAALAQMGRALEPRPAAAPDPARARLAALGARRRQLVEARKGEACRLQQAGDASLRRSHGRVIALYDREIARVEAEIAALVEATPELRAAAHRMRTAPGIGPVVAATLLAEMPELGTLDRRAVASLAGLAPIARDSGQRSPARSIGGGRPVPRRLLYLAALSASRHDPKLKAWRQALQDRGRAPKQAIVATARKLLTILNAMLKTGTDYGKHATA